VQALHPLRAILTTCVKHSALAFLLVVQALHPLRAILAACVKHLVAFWPSAYIAFGHAAFGHAAFGPSAFGHAAFGHAAFGPSAFGPSAFGPTAFGLTAFGHTAFDRVRHAFGARLYPLTLVWCVTWPPRSPLPTPTQRRGVDLGGAYTVLATEPVLEASTWFASTPYPACLWRTWALTFMVLSRHTWWASWEGRKLGAATPSWPSRV
jgi:hypothetical protein